MIYIGKYHSVVLTRYLVKVLTTADNCWNRPSSSWQ